MNDHVLQNLLPLNLLAPTTKKLRLIWALSRSKHHLHHLHFALAVQQCVPDHRLLIESARVSAALLPPQRPTSLSALLRPHRDHRLRLTVVHLLTLDVLQSMANVALQSIPPVGRPWTP